MNCFVKIEHKKTQTKMVSQRNSQCDRENSVIEKNSKYVMYYSSTTHNLIRNNQIRKFTAKNDCDNSAMKITPKIKRSNPRKLNRPANDTNAMNAQTIIPQLQYTTRQTFHQILTYPLRFTTRR